jgi:DNA-binding transcriptional ArsR family regulator
MTPVSAAPRHGGLFRAFGEPSRLLIAEALREGPLTVTEICRRTDLSQPNASNHLACLLGCGLVRREQQGRFVHYRLADERIEALLSLADEIGTGTMRDATCCPVCGHSA